MTELCRTPSCEIEDPAWRRLKAMVLDAMPAATSKRAYAFALDSFYRWYASGPRRPFSKAVVNEYRTQLEIRGYASSTIALHLSALRRCAVEAADNGLMDTGLAGAICRAKSPRRCGRRIGNWLGAQEVARLLDSINSREVKGIRDRAIFALGVGCGLRRGEIAALRVEQLQTREDRWVIVDLLGKHGRIRSVPMALWIKQYIDDWCAMADIHSGHIFRALDKSGRVARESMTGQAVYEVVKTHSFRIGLAIAPHDLRRTFAKLAFAAHARIEQIQYSLGHGTIATTEAYLGLSQDLVDAPSDRIKLPIQPLVPTDSPQM